MAVRNRNANEQMSISSTSHQPPQRPAFKRAIAEVEDTHLRSFGYALNSCPSLSKHVRYVKKENK